MKKIFLLTLLIGACFRLDAQNMNYASNELDAFRRQISVGRPDKSAYEHLFNAYQEYSIAIESYTFGTPQFVSCKNALSEIFPRLADGAYFYASLNDQESVLKFACAYVEVSLIPCLSSDGLQKSQQYAVLSNLAATNLYNRRQYDRSIKYFQAYLESGDLKSRETAFEGLARCLYEKKDYATAANICFQGSNEYQSNINILLIGIESCGHNGNDREMDAMLTKALRLQPNHRGLLEYQGKLYERQKRYYDAALAFQRMGQIQPLSLENTCHLAFDYYNAATLAYTNAKANGTSDSEAKRLYGLAAPHLRSVLDNSPYAANVARALAFCYSINNDASRLKEANQTLASLHSPTINFGSLPTLVQNYTPSAELNPVSADYTASVAKGEDVLISDVDINIPETHLNRSNTIAVIIANENYKKAEVQKVDFAHRDGKMFGEYCQKVLGLPKENVRITTDATLADMLDEIDYLTNRTAIEPGKVDIIFYYAGHGDGDFPNNKSYLMPCDVRSKDFKFCYSLDKLYSQFNDMDARSVTIFLDACFSGATRDGGMVSAGRYVRKAAVAEKAKGNTVVFSAASGEQAANAYKDKGHGYFTYFLLKALQETRGKISLSELGDRIKRDVQIKAYDLEKKEQTPQIIVSEALGSTWKQKTLID